MTVLCSRTNACATIQGFSRTVTEIQTDYSDEIIEVLSERLPGTGSDHSNPGDWFYEHERVEGAFGPETKTTHTLSTVNIEPDEDAIEYLRGVMPSTGE